MGGEERETDNKQNNLSKTHVLESGKSYGWEQSDSGQRGGGLGELDEKWWKD